MRVQPPSQAESGLAQYVHDVADRVEDDVLLSDYEVEDGLATAVLVVGSHVPTLAEKWLLLTWDEVNGWALRVTLNEQGDTTALSYLGVDVLPPAASVQHFLAAATSGHNPGIVEPPTFRHINDDDDLEGRLAELA